MANVDDRVVDMEFNNRSFETGVATTLTTLQKLKNALNFTDNTKSFDELDKAAAHFSMGNIGTTVEGVSKKFLALSTIGVTALATIANKAVNAGIQLTKSLTIDPIREGFQSYETQINAVQTILANTSAEGTKLPQVTAALAELNKYANLTVYNFSEMARNIGTFTAAGVNLKTSVSSIKGIANLAALSGSTSEQASGAMYQLSQAIAAGRVKLQDWNSVVNAGIGGKVFQTALINTARANGVAVDAIIKKQGSFRNSLQEGWITSKILTQTLSQFTGDLSVAQLKAQGFTEKEAQAILKQGQIAVDAATKIKTLTQLHQALKEEVATAYGAIFKTIFGNINEATALFSKVHTSVENALTNPIYAFNTLLQHAVKLGARKNVIDGLTNGIHALSAVLHVVTSAFREIFPPTTAKNIADATYTFKNFMHQLIPGEATLDKLKHTLEGVFAVFDIAKQVVGGVVGVLLRLFGAFQGGGSSVLTVTSNIGDYLVSLDKAIKSGTGLTNFFDKLGNVLVAPIHFLKEVVQYISSLFAGFDFNVADGISNTFDKMGQKISPVGKILSTIHDKIYALAHTLGLDFAPVMQAVIDLLGNFGHSISSAISSGNFTGVLRIIQTGLLGGILLTVKKFFASGETLLGRGFIGNLRESFEGITGSIKAMQTQIEARTVMLIAEAIAILTVSVVALSLVNPDKLSNALKAMAVGIGELLGSMKILGGISGAGGILKMPAIVASLDLLAAGLLLLTTSVVLLSTLSWADLTQGLTGVGVLLATVSAAAFVLSKNEGGMIAAGIGITAMAVGIDILAIAVKAFSLLSWKDLAKGLAGVAGALAAVAIGMQVMPKGMIITGIGLLEVAVALGGIYIAVKKFSELDWKQIGTGVGGIAAALVAIAVAMHLMPTGMVLQAAALLVIASALVVIQKAISAFGGMSWSEIGKGLAAMAASLAILSAAMYAMTGAVVGAVSLVIITAALLAFVPVLKALGGMSWSQILKGLVALAAAFVVLGVSGLLLAPVGPILLAIGAAITLIGAGVFLAGSGVAALAAGLGVLAASGAAGISVLLGAITSIIEDIPKVAVAFAQGLVNILKIIGENGPTIIVAFGKIIEALIKVVIQEAPHLAVGIGVLITAILKVLVDNTPKLLAAGFKILMDILQGIDDNIVQIVTAVANIIVNFLNALATHANEIIAAGTNLLIHVLEGIATQLGRIPGAVLSIVAAFISSLASHMPDFIQQGVAAVGNFLLGVIKDPLKIAATGISLVAGLISAVASKEVDMLKAGVSFIANFLLGIALKAANIAVDMYNLGRNIVVGIIHGLESLAGALLDKLRDIILSPIHSVLHTLHIESPSKYTRDMIGKPIIQGIIQGLDAEGPGIGQSLNTHVVGAINNITTTLSRIPSIIDSISGLNPTITPVLDLTQVTKDAAKLNGIVSVTPINTDISLRAANTVSLAQQEQAAAAAQQSTDSAQRIVNFDYSQTNNSPKALSTLDIYRQTKNQLGQAKRALDIHQPTI